MNQLIAIPSSESNPAITHHAPLLDKLRSTEAAVRAEPACPEHRWAMVELLCQLCQWERALQQLQALVRLAPQRKGQAHLVRGLIQAEHRRAQVFLGHERAAPVVDFPQWMQDMAAALEHNAAGRHSDADACREQALENAPNLEGVCHWDERLHAHEEVHPKQENFAWLSDSDTRLGPICEVMVAGAYRWLAFADIACLQMQAPQSPLDLVWAPAQLQLRSAAESQAGRSLHVYIAARACWPQPPDVPSEQQQALMLGRLTVWQDVGETGVFAQGQKTWMSEGIEWPVLDIREIKA